MFDYIEKPWLDKDGKVSIEFVPLGENRTNAHKTSYIGVVRNSISFSSSMLDFKTISTQINEKEYRRSVRFPLKHVKYFEVVEFYKHKDDADPHDYTLRLYVDMENMPLGIM